MIKVNKNLDDIPESLKPATDAFFGGSKIPQITRTTHRKRLEVIENRSYDDSFDGRYKLEDIKESLNSIYHHKCAFCEQRVEQIQVEHYRPKKTYYWLAFSWDNLLLACQTCNIAKGSQFSIDGPMVNFIVNDENINQINSFSSSYDETERPLTVNPEVIEPEGKIEFSKDGKINSNDKRFKHTIEKACKLNRKDLLDQRRKIIENFKEEIQAELAICGDVDEQYKALGTIMRGFKRRAYDCEETFLAFRQFALNNGWLDECIKELIH